MDAALRFKHLLSSTFLVKKSVSLKKFKLKEGNPGMNCYLMTLMYPLAAATWSAVAPVLTCGISWKDFALSHPLASSSIKRSSVLRLSSQSTPEKERNGFNVLDNDQ